MLCRILELAGNFLYRPARIPVARALLQLALGDLLQLLHPLTATHLSGLEPGEQRSESSGVIARGTHHVVATAIRLSLLRAAPARHQNIRPDEAGEL